MQSDHLFGVVTKTCYRFYDNGIALARSPDLNDPTAATDGELQALAERVNEDSLLYFHEGGGVWRPLGGGPYVIDDAFSIKKSFALCALWDRTTLPEWLPFRAELWNMSAHWTEGLCSLFGSVQEELLSQWRVLPDDSAAYEFKLKEQQAHFEPIVIPYVPSLPLNLQRGKECEELAQEI